jgi:hypothetical protein
MPRWPYGNPKSITGLLRFIDEDGWKTEVVCKDDSDNLTSPLCDNWRSILAQPPFAKWGFYPPIGPLKVPFF